MAIDFSLLVTRTFNWTSVTSVNIRFTESQQKCATWRVQQLAPRIFFRYESVYDAGTGEHKKWFHYKRVTLVSQSIHFFSQVQRKSSRQSKIGAQKQFSRSKRQSRARATMMFVDSGHALIITAKRTRITCQKNFSTVCEKLSCQTPVVSDHGYTCQTQPCDKHGCA